MNKYLALFLLMSCFHKIANCQIPNSSFENWEIANDINKPDAWSTNNRIGFLSVTRDNALSDGDFSVKIISNGISFEGRGPGKLETTFLPTSTFHQLVLSYKINSIILGGHIDINVYQFIDSEYKLIGNWQKDTIQTDSKMLVIPLSATSTDSLKIEVIANTELTDVGYMGYSEIIIDNLSLELATSTKDIFDFNTTHLYPNPTQNQLFIEASSEILKISLYDNRGRQIENWQVENTKQSLNLSQKKGIYYLHIKYANGKTEIKKLVVQ